MLMTLSALGNQQLEKLIIHHEKFRSYPYDDATGLAVKAPQGNITVGIGWNITAGIDLELALIILRYQLADIEKQLLKYTPFFADLSEVRKMVMFDMTLNLSIGRLLSFVDLMKALEQHDYNAAVEAMIASKWHVEVGERSKEDEEMMAADKFILEI